MADSCTVYLLLPVCFDYIHHPKNIAMIRTCKELGCSFTNELHTPQNDSLVLHGKSFVITGTLSISRSEMKKKIEKHGGSVKNAISANTDYLLYGTNPGSKYAKAQELQIPSITEKEFEDLVREH